MTPGLSLFSAKNAMPAALEAVATHRADASRRKRILTRLGGCDTSLLPRMLN